MFDCCLRVYYACILLHITPHNTVIVLVDFLSFM